MRKRLDDLRVIDYSPQQDGKVFFGAWVKIENSNDEVMRLRIVGGDEIFSGRKDYISIDSPMAKALLKKQVDDEAVVATPKGEVVWTIVEISYQH